MKVTLCTANLPPQPPLDLLAVSTTCEKIDTDGAFLYFNIEITTHHAFPEHADKLVYLRSPKGATQLLSQSSAFTRKQTLSIPVPLSQELVHGDQISVVYSLCLRKLKFLSPESHPKLGPALCWQIIFNVFAKVINKTSALPSKEQDDPLSDLETLKKAQTLLEPEDMMKEVNSTVIEPPLTAFTTRPSDETLASTKKWDHHFTGLQMIASATFF